MTDGETVTNALLPEELAQIPREYIEESDSPGTLVELTYDTYESMSYEEQDQVLKRGRSCTCLTAIRKMNSIMCFI